MKITATYMTKRHANSCKDKGRVFVLHMYMHWPVWLGVAPGCAFSHPVWNDRKYKITPVVLWDDLGSLCLRCYHG